MRGPRVLLIAWTAGPLAVLLPVDGDAVALVRPYVTDLELLEDQW